MNIILKKDEPKKREIGRPVEHNDVWHLRKRNREIERKATKKARKGMDEFRKMQSHKVV